jgi:hypothetical protein
MFGLKKKQVDKNKNVSEPQVKIVIKKLMGGKIPITINEFLAIQKKDESGNFIYINESQNFLEDASIIQDKALQELEERLNLSELDLGKKIELLEKKLKAQEKIVKSIKDGYYINEEVKEENKEKLNIVEERKLLIQLKVLRNVIIQPKEGSFEEINAEGFRQITYMHDDGLLIPYFHSAPSVTMYPAISTRKKYYKADQDLINQDYADENKSFGGVWFRSIMIIIFVVMFLGNMYWTFQINERANESMSILDSSAWTDLKINAENSAIKCAYYLATITETNKDFINFAKQSLNITEDNPLDEIDLS